VPSQGTDWTSVNVHPTYIPQDEGSTGGAAKNSGLLQGNAFRMWWHSRVEQRDLLGAASVETAEVRPELEKENLK